MTNTTRPPIVPAAAPAGAATAPNLPPSPAPGLAGWVGRRWLPAGVAALAVVIMLLVVGTPLLDIVRYAAYAGWCLVLPGTLVYRTLRRRPHSLVDDLALGTAVGLALELAAWATFSSAGAQRLLILWPLVVVLPYLGVPGLRRYWRRPAGYTDPPALWSWALAGIVVFAVGYLVAALMWTAEPVPSAPTWYHIDTLYLLSLVAEAKQHFPPQMPTVAGESLPYHIFLFAHEASASLVSGVDTPVVFYRLALPLLVALSAVLLAVGGWRVTGRAWVGPLAAALTFVVGEFGRGLPAVGQLGSVFAYYSYSSPTQVYGLVFTFALLGALAPVLRREAVGGRHWGLLGLVGLAASGAKSTVLPIVLAGLGGAGLAELIRRRRLGLDLSLGAAVLLTAFVAALAGLYRFADNGLAWAPLASVSGAGALAYLGAGLTYALYMLARLTGIGVLARLTGRTWDRPEWFLVSAFAAGWLGTVLLAHPGLSQNFFISTSFGFGAVASALGFITLAERYAVPGRTVALGLGGAGLASLLLYYSLKVWSGPLDAVRALPVPGVRSIVDLAVVFAIVGALVAGAWFVLVRRRVRRGVGAVIALAAVLLAGLPSLVNSARTLQQGGGRVWHVQVTPDEAQAARWLRDHSGSGDIVATNEHCAASGPSQPTGCRSLSFWLAAYSERRQLVGSWGYSPRLTTTGVGLAYTVPFWDPGLLAENDDAFTHPTPEGLARLRFGHHVRWLVVNRTVGPESPALARLAALRFERGAIAVYEL